MSGIKHSPGDGPVKRKYLAKLRAANSLYLAEMTEARREAERKRKARVKKVEAWLRTQPADAFQPAGPKPAKMRVKRREPAAIASVAVENRHSWSGRSTVSLPRLSCLEVRP